MALLTKFYGFHVAFEAAVSLLVRDQAFLQPRLKSHLVARDLDYLGVGPAARAGLPVCDLPLPMPHEAAAFGALYVVEGSTLGGTVIARHVEAVLGFGRDTGCAYFRSYGPDTGAMWRVFRERLASLSSPEHDAAIIAAATATFAAMQTWLCGGEGL